SDAAFSLASSTARSLTSTPVTWADGTTAAMASPITPYPHPRPGTRSPVGGVVSRNGTEVQMSTRPWAKTPLPDTSDSDRPHTEALTGSRWNGTDGSAVK